MTSSERARPRFFPISVALVGAGLLLVMLGTPTSIGDSIDLRYGVSRVDGDPGIAIHWVLCEGETAEVVDLGGHVGGSAPPNGVPVFWQIRTDDRTVRPSRVETYVVGQAPPGYYETVHLGHRLPRDLIVIDAPPGGGQAMAGMSFEVGTLPRDGISRGGYVEVTQEEFVRDGLASCEQEGSPIGQGLGLMLIGLGGALLATRRRPLALVLSLAVAGAGALELSPLALADRPPITIDGVARQGREAYTGGSTPLPAGARTLGVISPETTREVWDGFYVARINAPGPYAFVVGCSGPSIQIGEGASLPNGGTGSRQLIGCATGSTVQGAIADRSDRSDLVEIIVDASGSTDWQVVVIEGSGTAGPFTIP